MASIEKRGPHQYRAVVKRKGFKRITRTFPTKPAAKEWAEKVEADMKMGTYVDRSEAESLSLHHALQRYKDDIIPRLKQPDQEKYRAGKIQKRKIASLALAAIRPKDVADYISEREKSGAAANTIRLELSIISQIFEAAIREWGMDYLPNPVKMARKVTLPGGRTRRLQPATGEGDENKNEEEKLLSKCNAKFKPVVQFALETAMRRAEIAHLDWSCVDFKGKKVFLAVTKNNTSRTVPLSPRAIEILEGLPRNITGSVFGYAPSTISRTFAKAASKAGLKDIRFHDLRHEATSRLFENTDLDVLEVAEITGHKNLQMLKRYTHLRTERLVDRLAGASRSDARTT